MSRIKKLVRENYSFCLEKSGESQVKWILQSSRNPGIGPKLWPNYCIFWLNLVAMAMSFAPWKIRIAYLNSTIPKTLSYVQKCLPILCRNKICAVLAYFLSKFGCHGNAVCFIAYFYSQTPKTLLFTVKISRFLAQNWNQWNFGWRLLKFGCHGNSFWSLKIWIIYVNSLTPKTLLFTRKSSQYFTQNWNLCNFGLFLPIWLP